MTMTIDLLRSPNEATDAQRAVYDLLVEGKVSSLDDIRIRLGLRDIRPVRSRLQHLADKGIIAIS